MARVPVCLACVTPVAAQLTHAQLQRRADFDGYAPLSLRALVHYWSSHDQQHLAVLQWLLGKIESLPERI